MASYAITGASRGIGLELTRQLLALPSSQVGPVFALCRGASTPALRQLLDEHPDRAVHVVASVTDAASVQQAAQEVEAQLGGAGLDVLVNNAAVGGGIKPDGMRSVPPEDIAAMLDTNLLGVHRVTTAFLPLLERGAQKKIINVSSTLGSIASAPLTTFAPTPAYKISKAALHMLNAQYAVDLGAAGFTCLCLSPGWLKTDMGTENADLPVEEGVAEVKRIILEATPAQNGKFVDIRAEGYADRYQGGELPW